MLTSPVLASWFSFGGSVPGWFYAIVFAFIIIFILVSEWNSRR